MMAYTPYLHQVLSSCLLESISHPSLDDMIVYDIQLFKLFKEFLESLIFLFSKNQIKILFVIPANKQRVINFLIQSPLVCPVIP
jgi:hypothetical protein